MEIKKQPGDREFKNGKEMVLKGHDNNGKEVWVTAEYYDKPKMDERNKAKRSGVSLYNPFK